MMSRTSASVIIWTVAVAITMLSATNVKQKECDVCSTTKVCVAGLFCNKIEVQSGPAGLDSGSECLCTKSTGGVSLENIKCKKAILPTLNNGDLVTLKWSGACPK